MAIPKVSRAQLHRTIRTFAVIALPITLAACTLSILGAPPVIGSGALRSEPRPIAGVRGVEFSVPGDLDIHQGPVESLTIESDDNILPLVETTMRGDSLVITIKPGAGDLRPTALRLHLVVQDLHAISASGSGKVTMPDLRTTELALALFGSGSVSIDQLNARSIHMNASGSGQIHFGQLHADRVDTAISGSASIDVAGDTHSQSIAISGSGSYAAAVLASKETKIDISGSGSANIACADDLTASVSGSGNISYAGSPRLASSISGSGRIEQTTR